MKEKHGVTAIIYDEAAGARHFLLLHRVLNWSGWEFCKGGIDEGESPEKAVLREIEEETGLSRVLIVAALPKKVSWMHNGMRYVYTPFIVRCSMAEEVDLHQDIIEHDEYRWVAEEKVEQLLTHADNKKIFREALQRLGSRGV